MEKLPSDLVKLILEKLDNSSRCLARRVCRAWARHAPPVSGRKRKLCDHIAEDGHGEVIKWARNQGHAWDENTCHCAALSGNLKLLKDLKASGCPWNYAVHDAAIASGNIEMLEWLFACYPPRNTHGLSRMAARCNRREVLLWLNAKGIKWDSSTLSGAIASRNLELVKWLRGVGRVGDPGKCPWGVECCTQAAEVGNIEILEWLRNGEEEICPWDEGACTGAAGYGHLELLKWLREHGCPWDELACRSAARTGQLEVLKWLRLPKPEGVCPWDENTFYNAVERGHTQVVGWLREHECPWNEDACVAAVESKKYAARGYSGALLRWLRTPWRGRVCPWDERTCAAVAETGNLKLLKWLRLPKPEGVCPWDEETCEAALESGDEELVAWVMGLGRPAEPYGVCPWGPKTMDRLVFGGWDRILALLGVSPCNSDTSESEDNIEYGREEDWMWKPNS